MVHKLHDLKFVEKKSDVNLRDSTRLTINQFLLKHYFT